MSQEKVTRNKNAKRKQQERQKKKKNHNLGWAIAGCIIFGLIVGFFAGKYWLYPKYMGSSDADTSTVYDTQDRSGELQDLNDQIDRDDAQ